jgi:hypothetical protein
LIFIPTKCVLFPSPRFVVFCCACGALFVTVFFDDVVVLKN